LLEKTVPMSVEEAYGKLRSLLAVKNCKFVEELPSKTLVLKQGSLSGVMPKSAKKTIRFELSSLGSETKVVAASKIDPVWTSLTLYGSILAAVLAGLLFWVAADMEAYVLTAKAGVWSWLAGAYGYPDVSRVLFTVSVNRAAAVLLVLTVAFEIAIAAYVYPRKDAFGQEVLAALR
jgi:hypothetical protein